MSTIRKAPFIEGVLDLLSDEQLTTFKGIMNGTGTNVYKTLSQACSLSNGVYAVNLQLDEQKLRSGILIITTTQQAFIAYHRYQDVELYEINKSAITYNRINEYCDINELRRIVAEFDSAGGVSAWETAIKGHLKYSDNSVGVFSGTDRFVDMNTSNKTTSLYHNVKIGSSETPSTLNMANGIGAILSNGVSAFWVGTQAEFEALSGHTTGTIYFVQQEDNTVNIYRY